LEEFNTSSKSKPDKLIKKLAGMGADIAIYYETED
jgi:hypothetical protein